MTGPNIDQTLYFHVKDKEMKTIMINDLIYNNEVEDSFHLFG